MSDGFLLAPRLQRGDRVRLVSPASYPDRQLTQLVSSGALDGVVGVALGSFEGFRDYSDRGWTLADVLADRLGQLGVPVLGGIFAGHDLLGRNGGPDQMALPLGSFATLDTDEGTLTMDPVVY